jgi:hypothetical protein
MPAAYYHSAVGLQEAKTPAVQTTTAAPPVALLTFPASFAGPSLSLLYLVPSTNTY